jgi:hypothetical protein
VDQKGPGELVVHGRRPPNGIADAHDGASGSAADKRLLLVSHADADRRCLGCG